MADPITLGPDHPFLLQGRRHARDVIESAARIGRATGDEQVTAVVSTSLQLVLSAALVDGVDPHEAYSGLAGAIAWAVCRLPEEGRAGVLQAIVAEVVKHMAEVSASEAFLNIETVGRA